MGIARKRQGAWKVKIDGMELEKLVNGMYSKGWDDWCSRLRVRPRKERLKL